MNNLYIGVMSGTSLDAIDCVIVDFSNENIPQLIQHYSQKIPSELKQSLLSLTIAHENEIELMVKMDVELGDLIAECCLQVLKNASLTSNNIKAIGSHGQTIRHYPHPSFASSLQIGDANIIAERTAIKTITDFRRRDMAANGQGAPLVPPFHQLLFAHDKLKTSVVNIGGISNITCLNDAQVIGYDTGPGNTLLDIWCQKHFNCDFDENGEIATSGHVCDDLLQQYLSDPFFLKKFPKSTGREHFGQTWLAQQHQQFKITQQYLPSNTDILTTLVELTAQTITQEIKNTQNDCAQLLVCGGGAQNTFLLKRLQSLSPQWSVKTTDDVGIASQWIESMAFAWLAKQTLEGKAGNLPSVTGARHPAILGAIYQA